jgi:hypothetical protein
MYESFALYTACFNIHFVFNKWYASLVLKLNSDCFTKYWLQNWHHYLLKLEVEKQVIKCVNEMLVETVTFWSPFALQLKKHTDVPCALKL